MGYRFLAAAAVALLAAGVWHDAEAETVIDVKGHLYAVGEVETLAETEALLLRRSTMVAAFAADDQDSALHLATFNCAFTSHTANDPATRHQGRVGALGACLVSDRDGDLRVAEWQRSPGEEVGGWTVVRGSGKYAGAGGEGTYGIEFLSRPPKPQLRFRLDGKIILE